MIPGATVVLVSETRGTKSAPAVTNETGDYVLPNVTPDTYTVEVTMEGFKTLKRPASRSAPATACRRPLTLEVGGATETVKVTAEAPLIQAPSGERSFTITTDAGREPADREPQLRASRQLAPGVIRRPTRRARRRRPEQRHDGRRLDDGHRQQRPMLQMNIEAIAEVKVLTSGYQAEYGRSSGLQISAVTKSGTNRFRGRSTTSSATPTGTEQLGERARTAMPKTDQQGARLGLLIGGPVGKPGGNNKLFFFYSQECRPRNDAADSVNRFRVPTALERAGDFSQSRDNNGNSSIIRDARPDSTRRPTPRLLPDGGVVGRSRRRAVSDRA